MRIDIERSGGFAGMLLRASIDTDTLPPEQAKELAPLLDAAHFFELPTITHSPSTRADQFRYKITIESEGRTHTVETGDESAPSTLRPLLRRLTALARPGGSSNR